MSIKETITKELLDRIDDPAGLEEVLKRHGRSKGPLYSALAEATAQLRRQYESLVQETQRLAARQAQAESEISVLEGRQRSLGLKARGMEKDIGQKEARLSEVRGLIETADRLEGQGFGKDNLEQLFNLLAETGGYRLPGAPISTVPSESREGPSPGGALGGGGQAAGSQDQSPRHID